MYKLRNYQLKELGCIKCKDNKGETIFVIKDGRKSHTLEVFCMVPDVGDETPVCTLQCDTPITHPDIQIDGYKLLNGYELIVGDLCQINVVSKKSDKVSRTVITINHKYLGKSTQSYYYYDKGKDGETDYYSVDYSGRILEYNSYIDTARFMNDIALDIVRYNPAVLVSSVK